MAALRTTAPVTRRIVFWEPIDSPHKAGLFSALARLAPDCSIVHCADRGLGADYAALGWQGEDNCADGVETLVAPGTAVVHEIAAARPQESLHVFSGTRWVPTIVEGLRAVRRAGARFAIMSEPRVREGWKGELRFLQSWLTERALRRRVSFVLAIGRNGPPWFTSVGYAGERVFPYAYFVDPPRCEAAPTDPSIDRSKLQIGYLGRLVEEKGIFDIVRSAALLADDCQLHVAGGGPEEARLRGMAKELHAPVTFHGVIPMPNVGRLLSALDVLVLASTTKDDGWGVVVSEALMCGTAAIATDRVGASLVLDVPERGRVVPAGRPDRIADAVRELAASGVLKTSSRSARAAWARSALSASAGAAYLLKVIAWSEGRAPRPAAFHLQ